MSFELSYKAELAADSKRVYDKFVSENRERKEVDYHDVFELLASAAASFAGFKLSDGKRLDKEQQHQLLSILYNTLVRDQLNDFAEDPRIASIIDTILKLRDGEFEIDLGKEGKGCFPCCASFKISARKDAKKQ